MSVLPSILTPTPYSASPQGLLGWLIWFALLGVVVGLLVLWRRYNKRFGRAQWLIFIGLIAVTPFTSLFLGIQIPANGAQVAPGLNIELFGQAAMIFSAAPWILAGGLLGPLGAAGVALLAGIIGTLWNTHNPYTILEIIILAVVFSALVSQRYRTTFFRWLRQPFVAGVLLALLFPILFLISAPFTIPGPLVLQLNFAISNLASAWLVFGIAVLTAALLAQIAAAFLPTYWGSTDPLEPSPAERSFYTRLLSALIPITCILALAVMTVSWIVADQIGQEILKTQMTTSAASVANQLPAFLETGEHAIYQLSWDPRFRGEQAVQSPDDFLAQLIKSAPFFHQIIILDENGEYISAYPDSSHTGTHTPSQEWVAIQLASVGFSSQVSTLPPSENGLSAQISFITPVYAEDGTISNILVGRTDFTQNPFAKSLLTSIQEADRLGGTGILLDENGRALVHPDPAALWETYRDQLPTSQLFFKETMPDGSRDIVLIQPLKDAGWSLAFHLPETIAQGYALKIALPILAAVALLSVLAIVSLRQGLKYLTGSLISLTDEANYLAQGDFGHPISTAGEDEIAQLRSTIENVRLSMSTRLDEMSSLLTVSQGVASHLEIEVAVQPILESAITLGAVSARIVLLPSIAPDWERIASGPITYSLGKRRDDYSDLDDQILALSRRQDRLILTELTRPRLLNLTPGRPNPASLIASALRHENQFYGVLWVAYDQSHSFSDKEVRFITALSNQAAIASSNAQLFQNAEIGRQRLSAILSSSPDPILVIDQYNCLTLSNPAARQLFDLTIESELNQPVERIVQQKELLTILRDASTDNRSAEITFPPGRVYLAAVSSVVADGRRVGQVCVLRDVTQFKELDALKSEFVATVSHDLRTPLTLMRGYATMLEMVGQLNDQQVGYVRKIISGVESMSRLVSNLLDLGRIEAGVGLTLEKVHVKDVIERTIGSLQIQANQKKVHLKSEFSEQSIRLVVEADPALLQQALSNLVENAIRFNRAEGEVVIRAHAQPERIVFEVADTGIGISPMDQARLFDKFYRGPQQTLQENQGSGLGLAIVKSIADSHHGQVWVDSQLGRGSTFFLSLPLRQPHE